jgi:IMP dehydrogenase/GMP reductase
MPGVRDEADLLRPLLPAATDAVDEDDRITAVIALGVVEGHFAGVVLFFG